MKNLKILVVVVVLVLGLTSVLMADDVETHDGTTISGTVPFVASWDLTEDDRSSFTSGVNVAAFDANEIVVTDLIQITDFDCNTKFKITATKGTWTLPEDYHEDDGAKQANGSDSDLLLMVDNVTAGYDGDGDGGGNDDDGLAALGRYGSYTAIETDGSDIIGGGAVGEEEGHGVENAAADINAKVLMDWSTDIVGDYSIDVTLTITEVYDD